MNSSENEVCIRRTFLLLATPPQSKSIVKKKKKMEKFSKTQNSDSNRDPPPSIPISSPRKSRSHENENDPESCRDPKRRKNCPTTLDSIQDFAPPNPNFSFSFDTKFSAATSPERTPKFGSFNLVVPTKKEESECHESLQDKVTAVDTVEDGDGEEVVICSSLKSISRIEEIE